MQTSTSKTYNCDEDESGANYSDFSLMYGSLHLTNERPEEEEKIDPTVLHTSKTHSIGEDYSQTFSAILLIELLGLLGREGRNG